jgi:3-oxoacyl-[acyl-carrier protein] reductase
MKTSSILFLSALARTDAFMGVSLKKATFASRSSLQMVADDAKVCLVTGSSRGLGRAIAVELGKYGQKVVVNYMSPGSTESAEETVRLIKEAGGDAIAVMGDGK